MNIYFSEAPIEDIESFGDEGTFVTLDDLGTTRYFYNGVEHGTNPGGTDEVRIFDGCNRSIPIAVDNIPELVEALNYCYNNMLKIKETSRLQQRLISGSECFVENFGDFNEVHESDI